MQLLHYCLCFPRAHAMTIRTRSYHRGCMDGTMDDSSMDEDDRMSEVSEEVDQRKRRFVQTKTKIEQY